MTHVYDSLLFQATDTSNDEALARELQAQFNSEVVVSAQPAASAQMPFNCGACGVTHMVRNATDHCVFKCAACGVNNRIMTRQPVVVVYVNDGFFRYKHLSCLTWLLFGICLM